jgi:hypothetical protein
LTILALIVMPFGITLDMSLETVIGLLVNGLVVMVGVYFTRNKPVTE